MNEPLQSALAHHQAGRLAEAEQAYRQILQQQPDHGDAQNLLGALLCQRGQLDDAIPLLESACAQLPHFLEARMNLAKALRMADRPAEALAAAEHVLATSPDRADALILKARCLRRMGQPDKAKEILERLLVLSPQMLDAHLNLGDLLQESEPDAAATHYEAVLKQAPGHTGALNNLALIHKRAGRLEPARQLLEHVVRLKPTMHEALNNLGNVLLDLGLTEEAVSAYRQASTAAPDNPLAFIHLGNALRLAGHTDEARATLEACLQRWRNHSGAHNNLGILLDLGGDHHAAIHEFQSALQNTPQDADIWANLSGALLATGDRAGARQACEHALSLQPDSATARFAMANIQLLEGDWRAGWQNYEFRWQGGQQAGKRVARPNLPWPQWRGEPVPSAQRLFVFHEQGFGDTLQFMRYLPELADRFARIAFVCQPALIRLARANLPPSIEVIASEAAPDFLVPELFDWQLPLMSLPLALDLQPTVSRQRLAPLIRPATPEKPLRVGLCWSGNPALTADAERSIPLERFAPLLNLPHIRWHSLTFGGDLQGMPIENLMQNVRDFTDTAEHISALDLVISVDTAVAHLAAGMSKPTWLLNRFAPDWRWGHTGHACAWYPCLRQYRQQTLGDWSAPLHDIAQALRNLAS